LLTRTEDNFPPSAQCPEPLCLAGFNGPDRRAGGPLRGERWQWGGIEQAPTVLSLLTPEYLKRYVQMLYHETVDNSKQWSASFCLPEGFLRWWAGPSNASNFELTITPTRVEFLSGIADNAGACVWRLGSREDFLGPKPDN
jgi:hypothetical protein